MRVDADEAFKARGRGGEDARVTTSKSASASPRSAAEERRRGQGGGGGGGVKMSFEGAKLRPPKPFLSIKSISSSAMKTPAAVSSFGSGGRSPTGEEEAPAVVAVAV